MADLLTRADLAIWIQGDIEDEAFADVVISAASELVCVTAQQPTWTIANAPIRARQIAAALAARSYKNPDSALVEGSVGALSGDRLVEDLARFLHLTNAEIDELVAMQPTPTGAGGGLWVQPVGGATPVDSSDIYLFDNSGSDWGIPMFPAGSLSE